MTDSRLPTEGPETAAPLATGSVREHDTISRSFLALGGGEAAARVVAFLAMLVVARRLGAEGLGVVSFAAAVLLYLARVVDAGFDFGIGLREAAARRDTLGEFIPPVLALRVVLAIVVIAITALSALTFLPELEGQVITLYSLTLIPLALSVRWVLTGLDHASVSGIARGGGEFVAFAAVVLVTHAPADIWRIPVAQFLGDTVAATIAVIGLRRIGVPVGLRWRTAVIKPLIVRHIAPYVGSTLLGIVLFNVDVLFLRYYRDVATVGLYASAYTLVSFVLNIGGMYALSVLPALTRLTMAPGTRQEVYEQAAGKVFLVVLPITVGGAMVAADILRSIYRPEFTSAAGVLALLLVSVPISLLRSLATMGLIAAHREDYLLRIVGVSAAVNVLANFLVVPIWGMMGAAAVTLATEVLRLVLSQRYAGLVGFGVPRFTLGRKPVIAVIVMALVVAPIRDNVWLAIPAGALAYGVTLLALGGLRFRRGRLPEVVV